MMNKWSLLLVVALAFHTGGGSLANSAIRSGIQISGVSVADESPMNGERMLRGFKTTDGAVEERVITGIAEKLGKLEKLEKLEKFATKTRLAQRFQAIREEQVAERMQAVKKLLDSKASFKTLRRNKVTTEEYANALGFKMSDVPLVPNANVIYPDYGKVARYGRLIADGKL